MTLPLVEDTDAGLVRSCTGLLRLFNAAGVLGPADVHTATAVARIGGESDEAVMLALALTVRALRTGSVCIDLRTISETVYDDSEQQVDVSDLPWPAVEDWRAACERSPLVSVGPYRAGDRPLRLAFGLLYLERYWQQEETVRIELQRRLATPPPVVDAELLAGGLARIFSRRGLSETEPDRQRLAAAVSALRWLLVLAGGPGTGKTTTVAKLLALLGDQRGSRPRIALAAPTGKAAARLEEAVRAASGTLPPADRERLGELNASTLHRLLGWQPGNRGRFRHDRENHLPYDVIVVDEMSMVSLTMMARLLEAVRPDARLVLVGDPDQLSSVEAGAVMADVVNAPGEIDRELGSAVAGIPDPGSSVPAPTDLRHGVVQLTHTWRFGAAIDELARAIRAGDPDWTMQVLRSDREGLVFAEVDLEQPRPEGLGPLAERVRRAGRRVDEAARAGLAFEALAALDLHRLLCAHRSGPFGVARWGLEAERWLAEAIEAYGAGGEWYVGRPLLVTANDYDMGLYNGDTGVVLQTEQGLRAAFARGGEPLLYSPVRLDSVQTVHAMTVHRAQGSQFEAVSFIVPPEDSPLLTRELLYTAVTRATRQVQIFGSEASVRKAVQRPANRASGLRDRLGAPSQRSS
ncbi:exodeoxyribonuclease V subunit alpha [Microlunatus panaciterrae]|uniref:RecBCD enzyme subunit RecD n=1 Tax=Microlunatus panaciterrae TaxID=400768 RepID=A0ABS2RES8_9ACTN|nr:exodeoxyribonuclease V subunit alpha [Microlunatus panaciterrae]MBM7797500.1 exodeoxyribonuclease V alpha subunit [Microlunatus panaciterrae]